MEKHDKQANNMERPPVVVVMGHIDHGKSTLLDYIRKTNVVGSEAGGITQRLSAYEVVHKDEHGKDKKITFLDTPGHEAFSKMRERGAQIADIAILVVSASEGVKPQTLEAWKTAVNNKIPVIVAINKTDKPEANVEKTKIELAENEIYLENYGGKTPVALISAKTGAGVDELLSLVLILAEMENFTSTREECASGFVIEANLDPKRGIEATLIIKNGTLQRGMTVVTEDSLCSTRIMEDFNGAMLSEAGLSSPVRLVGFNKMPRVGAEFKSFQDKRECLECVKSFLQNKKSNQKNEIKNGGESKKIIPIVLKADVLGMVEAIEKEIGKIAGENAEFKIIQKGVGSISETDLKTVSDSADTLVIGFNVKADKSAAEFALKRNISIVFFDIIYKMTEWLTEEMEKRRPRIETTEITGQAKILKTFSRTKERQIVGGRVLTGRIALLGVVKIIRREFEIGRGKIVNLEKGKAKVGEVEEGAEFGMMFESKIEVAPGDMIELFSVIQK
ncbi:MAG: translation initiation factor IF-2 [bacterium]|nr:translation initiation factor IF-2 [bacterium]